MTKVFIVIPAYNEEGNILGLLNRISDAMADVGQEYSVIAVDDGSTDRTSAILAREMFHPFLKVVTHTTNHGLGTAIRDGIRAACIMAHQNDIIVTLDGDESHNPGLIPRMVARIREGHDIVIASRYQPGSRVCGLSLKRRLISRLSSYLMQLVAPIEGVSDYTCGYRAYRASILMRAAYDERDGLITEEGFQCMIEILLKLRKQPYIFGEVPMILRYDRKLSQTKMKVTQTMIATLKVVWRLL